MKIGRFVIDTHVHAQRFASGQAQQKKAGTGAAPDETAYTKLSHEMKFDLEPYDNSPRLLYDMECYGVDVCVLLPAFSMTNALNARIMKDHPGKFVCLCRPERTLFGAKRGEFEWSPEAAAQELDELLSTGDYVGIGEAMPGDPLLGDKRARMDIHLFLDEVAHYMEVARKHRVPVRWHTGITMGYATSYSHKDAFPETFNPLWVHDLAIEFPDVPIIFDHGGVQGGWWERWHEECLNVAAATDNVYLETGLWWSELYEKPLRDPNIGAKKLLWGTDWGASIPFVWQPGGHPAVYAAQGRQVPPVRHQVDFWGWSLRQLRQLNIPQDDLNLIVGGNAARVYRIPVPHTRLFPFVE